MHFSIIIPNWNGKKHLDTCLSALRRQTYTNFETILVDNASTDDSVEFVSRAYPEVRIIELTENRGLAGGINIGAGQARGEIIVSLNNDTEADARWLEELVAAFIAYPAAGMVASKMLLFDRRDTIHTTGDLYGADGIPRNRGVWEKDQGQYDDDIWVFGACGGTAAYRRTMLADLAEAEVDDKFPIFDEDFFMYCEDVDLNWRAQLRGWKCVFAPKAIVYHKLSASGAGKIASFYTGRNTIRVIAKNYPTALLRQNWRAVSGAQWRVAKEALQAWRGEAARARLRGQIAGLLSIPRMLRKRHIIQATRRVSDAYLDSILYRD